MTAPRIRSLFAVLLAGLVIAGCGSGGAGAAGAVAAAPKTDADHCIAITDAYKVALLPKLERLQAEMGGYTQADRDLLAKEVSEFLVAVQSESKDLTDSSAKSKWAQVVQDGSVASMGVKEGSLLTMVQSLTPFLKSVTAGISKCTELIRAATPSG